MSRTRARRSGGGTLLRRLLYGSLALMIPAIALPVLITTNLFYRDLERSDEAQTLAAFRVAETRIGEVIGGAINTVALLERNDVIYDCLHTPCEDILETVKARRAAAKLFDDTFTSSTTLDGAIFIKSDGSSCGATTGWRFFYSESFPIHLLGEGAGTYHTRWLGVLPQQTFTPYRTDVKPKLSDCMVFGLRSYPYTRSDGRGDETVTVLFAISCDALLRCYEKIADADSTVELLDSQGRRLTAKTYELCGTVPDYYGAGDGSSYRCEIDGEACQVVTYTLAATDWTLAKVTPVAVYTQSARTLVVTSLIIGAATIAVMVTLLTFWARRFCAPILRVTNALERVQDGDLDVRLPEDAATEEVQVLERQYNRMLDSLSDLLAQKEKDERDKLALEVRSLQAQLTPHFIYNTITAIRFTATMCGAETVAEMLRSLISLLRPVFGTWTPEWTLSEELKFAENYMSLMRLRAGPGLRFEVNAPEELSDCMVPRFTLQPVLENCCEHGGVTDRTVTVRIDIRTDTAEGPRPRDTGPALVIAVEDDGDGMPEERLRELRERLRTGETLKSDSAHAGIGLANINRRIRLNYGPAYGLCVDSAEGEGTRVELWLGLRRNV